MSAAYTVARLVATNRASGPGVRSTTVKREELDAPPSAPICNACGRYPAVIEVTALGRPRVYCAPCVGRALWQP